MVVRQITPDELSRIASSVYFSKKWINILDSSSLFYGILNDSSQLAGGFVLRKDSLYGLNFFRPPRFMNNISLHYTYSSKNISKLAGEEKKLMLTLADFFDHLPFHILTVYFPVEYTDMQPFFWKKFKVIPYYTYIIDLLHPLDQIEGRFSPERRNDISKAIKDGIICKKENLPEIVKRLALETFARKEKKIESVFFDRVLFDFADSDNSATFISYQNGNPIAVAFCIFDSEKMYYLIGGYNNSLKHQGAGALAVSHAIMYAKEKGIHYFDFEGSMLPEVEKYFRGFGGVLTPYYSINKAKMPLEILLKFFKRSVF